MGNIIVPEVKDQMKQLANNIFEIGCPILDIGDREGPTGYIDFIKPQELGVENIMKGKDKYNRNFIVFKSIITQLNYKPMHFFTTFFERYNNEYDVMYHTAGHYGALLFETEGGTTISQMNILYELLKNGNVELTYDQIQENKFEISKSLKNNHGNIDDEIKNLVEIIKIESVFPN